MTMGLKLASAGDAKDDQKTQNVPVNVAKTGRVFFFLRARGKLRAESGRASGAREFEKGRMGEREAKQWLSSTLAGRHLAARERPCAHPVPPP